MRPDDDFDSVYRPPVCSIDGHREEHARLALLVCGERTMEVLREASRAACSEMPPEDVASTVSSLLPKAAFVQVSPDGYVSFGVPNEPSVRVAVSALRETFYHRLLAREVMCA